MRKIAWCLGCLVLSALFVSIANADCRRVVRIRAAVVVDTAVVTPAVAAVFAPVAVTVPAYSVGYSADNSAIIKELQGLRKDIADFIGQPGAAAPIAAPHVALAAKRCAECHGASPRGNKYVMFDAAGKFIEPSDAQLGEINLRVAKGDMPRGRPMTPDERLAFIASINEAPPPASPSPAATPKMPPAGK